MNPQDPLANLAPLREPPAPDWWPPAPGWWLLAFLLLAAVTTLAWFLWRRYRARRYRRLALAQLRAAYAAAPDPDRFQAECNTLLKAVAIRSYGHREVASLSGDTWVAFLNGTAPGRSRELFRRDWLADPYRPGGSRVDTDGLLRASERWIRSHGAQHA